MDDILSFTKDNWTSAQARHKSMPTSHNHWMRSQMRCGSLAAVRARPVPDETFSGDDDDFSVEVFIRRKKLVAAWSLMKSCDINLWTEVCGLYALIIAVEQDEDPGQFEDYAQVLNEVAEAKVLMYNAEILRAVETIEAFNEGEWKKEQSPACVRRGSLMVVPEHNNDNETRLEAKVRHVEHAQAWELMKSCDKEKWAAVCHYHEDQRNSEKGNHPTTPMQASPRQLKPTSADLKLGSFATNTHFPARKPPQRNGSWSHAA